jgi:hypothetical protein
VKSRYIGQQSCETGKISLRCASATIPVQCTLHSQEHESHYMKRANWMKYVLVGANIACRRHVLVGSSSLTGAPSFPPSTVLAYLLRPCGALRHRRHGSSLLGEQRASRCSGRRRQATGGLEVVGVRTIASCSRLITHTRSVAFMGGGSIVGLLADMSFSR